MLAPRLASRSNDVSLADTWHLVYLLRSGLNFMTPSKHLSIAYQGINLWRLLRFFFLSKAPHADDTGLKSQLV